MRRTLIVAVAVVVAAGALVVGGALLGQRTAPEQPAATVAQAEDAELTAEGVTVEAVGTVEGTPDVLTAQVGVHVEADTVSQAYEEGNAAAADVRDALVDAGVEDGDLQTAQLSLGPAGRPSPDEEPEGYEATTSLRAELRDLDAAGEILDEAVEAAGEAATLRSLGFSLDDDAGLADEAREAAFEEARAKAEQYADLADRSLGALQGLSESADPGGAPPQPVEEAEVMEDDAAGPPVEPGEEKVQVRIRGTWALD